MIARLLGGLLALAVLASPASASRVYEKPPAALDPTKAYVVVEIGKLDDAMLYGTLILSRYDSATGDIALPAPLPDGKTRGSGSPTDDRARLTKPAMKDKERRLYIAELEPGLWVVEGANDTAFSLGSSTLQLVAGTVTDLGVASIYSDFPDGEKRDVLTAGRLMKSAIMGGLLGGRLPAPMPKAVDFNARGTDDMPLPPVLKDTAQPVSWAGEVRFGNHLNGLVNRMGGRKARIRAQAAQQANAVSVTAGTPQVEPSAAASSAN